MEKHFDLTNSAVLKSLLQKYNYPLDKKLGQNFLISKVTLKKIIQASKLKSTDYVIEVGTGIGTLTEELSHYVKRVTSIEIDKNLKNIHKETLGSSNIEILYQNALDFEPPQSRYKLIANIPYYITSPLLSHFLKNEYLNNTKRVPELIVLMIQKEVAEKLCAQDKRGVLALNTQPFAYTEIVHIIPRSYFFPCPKVDSAIVKITPYKEPKISGNIHSFFKLVETGFSQKRKKIINSLASKENIPREKIKELLLHAGIDGNRRAETLSIEEWDRLNNVASNNY